MGLILGLFIGVFILELFTPPNYVMGYLYIAPILWANPRLDRADTFKLTGLAVILTLGNIWIPGKYAIEAPMVINRLIAVLALVVTGILSDRNRDIQNTLLEQQARLQA